MSAKQEAIVARLKSKHPKASDKVIEKMTQKLLKAKNSTKANSKVISKEKENDKEIVNEQSNQIDLEKNSEELDDSEQDSTEKSNNLKIVHNDNNSEDDDDDDDDDEDYKPPARSAKDDFDDFKQILVQELGPKMKKQIENIENEENQSDEEQEANVEQQKGNSNKNLNQQLNIEDCKQQIDYIHQRIPELEPKLIEELLKYDDNVVFVGDVPSHLDKRKLTQLFRQFGPVQSVRIRGLPGSKHYQKKIASIQKKVDPASKVTAYVVFESVESADNAVQFNQKLIGEYKFRIHKATHFEKRVLHKVILRNLPPRTKFPESRKIVTDFLAECGQVIQVKVFREKPTDGHFSTALVFMDSSDSVQLALRKNGQQVGKNTIKVELHNDRVKLGFKNKGPESSSTTGADNKPVHKKKLLKKRLREAKRNAKSTTQKVSYGKKKRTQL